MKHILTTLTAILFSLALVSCAAPGQQGINNEGGGTLIGGALGGLLGSQVGGSRGGKAVAMVGGAVLGGLIGNRVGQSMDEADRMRTQQAMQSDLATNWHSNSGKRYAVNKPYLTNSGKLCRNISINDNSGELIEGTACCKRLTNSRCEAWGMIS